MANVTDFKALKRRQARKRIMKLAALIAAVLMGTYFLSSLVNTPDFVGFSAVLDMVKGGPGYPIDAPGGKIKGMYQNKSNLVILNETTIYFYNTSGSQVYSAQHRMGNPQVETSGSMLLNYDRGSKTYAAYSRNNLFYSGKTDSAIRCGDISQNGCIAIATQTETAQTQVLMMDSRQREQYVWKTDYAVTALSLSDNGSLLAIASSYVEEGELKNAITVLKNGKELYRYELANQLVLELEFDGSSLRCVTDRSAFLLSSNGKIAGQFDYKGQALAAYSMYEDGIALLFGNYEQDRKYTLASVADDFFTLKGTATVTDSLQKLKAYNNTILVLGSSALYSYSAYDCSFIQQEGEEAYYDIQPIGNSVYTMTTTEINRLPMPQPSKFTLFGAGEQQQLPDGEQPAQSQEDLDLLEGILNGMKDNPESSEEQEPTVGESKETIYEEGFIEKEEEKSEDTPAESEKTPVEEDHELDIDDPNGALNQEPERIPIQNEEMQPEFSNEDDINPLKEKPSSRPAASQNKTDKEEETNQDEQSSDRIQQSEGNETEQPEQKEKDEPVFSSRRPAS